ncbi:glycosyltransferase family 2 protein [Gemmatimonadota bacterium]
MSSPNPLVSVVIPVHNGASFLAEAIESVLSQGHRPLEVIVVDDGSTDDSAGIAESFAPLVRCLRQPNLGTGAARNRGMEDAGGEFWAGLDADDLWPEGRLERQMEVFAADPTADLVTGHVSQVASPELDETAAKRILNPRKPVPGGSFGAMVIRREAAMQVGPLATHWEVGQDMEWFLRVQEAGLRIVTLPDIVLLRRLHGENKGIRKKQFAHHRVRILKEAMDRRRLSSAGEEVVDTGGEGQASAPRNRRREI